MSRLRVRGWGFMPVRRTAVVSALAMAAALASSDARAEFLVELQDVSASAEYQWRASPFGDLERRGSQRDELVPPEFSAFAAVNNARGGRAAAYQDGFGINAVFAESQDALDDAYSFSALAETNYDVIVSTPTEETGQAVFEFVINGGELRLENFASIEEGVSVSEAQIVAAIEIFPGGFWVLDWTLQKFLGAPEIFDASIDSFGIGFPTATPVVDGEDVVVIIPRFEGETLIDREDFFPGAFPGVSFHYSMMAQVDLENGALGGLAGIGDPFSLSAGGPSTDGIEFFLDGLPLSSYALVPEPGSAAMFILGTFFLGRRSRPRRSPISHPI